MTFLLLLTLPGCLLTNSAAPTQMTPGINRPTGEIPVIPATRSISPIVTPETTPEATPVPYVDESGHVRGICFESAWDAVGRIFIIRSAEEHIRFYNQADNSGLCRRPVSREPRDFSNGYVIAGFWSKGRGCTANHTMREYIRSDDAQLIVMWVVFNTEGDCPYDLVRPFWVGLPGAANYEITFIVE